RLTLAGLLPRCELDPPASMTLSLARPSRSTTTSPPQNLAAAVVATPTGTASAGAPVATLSAVSSPVSSSTNIIAQERVFAAWSVQHGFSLYLCDYSGNSTTFRTIHTVEE